MARRCKYTVTYGTEVAKFSDRSDAITFARIAGFSEVRDSTGLIGQFQSGEPTPEFASIYPGYVTDEFEAGNAAYAASFAS